MRFILRIIFNAIALALTTWILSAFDLATGPGFFTVNGLIAWLIIALIFGLVNALIRPIVALLTCPLVILTLGLFTFVINAAMLWLTSLISQNLSVTGQVADIPFRVNGFVPALVGSVVVSLVSIVLTTLVRDRD